MLRFLPPFIQGLKGQENASPFALASNISANFLSRIVHRTSCRLFDWSFTPLKYKVCLLGELVSPVTS
jgi:hypothetical protein